MQALRLRLSLLLVVLLTLGLCLTTVEAKKKKITPKVVPVAEEIAPEGTDTVGKLDEDTSGTTVPVDGAVVEEGVVKKATVKTPEAAADATPKEEQKEEAPSATTAVQSDDIFSTGACILRGGIRCPNSAEKKSRLILAI